MKSSWLDSKFPDKILVASLNFSIKSEVRNPILWNTQTNILWNTQTNVFMEYSN